MNKQQLPKLMMTKICEAMWSNHAMMSELYQKSKVV